MTRQTGYRGSLHGPDMAPPADIPTGALRVREDDGDVLAGNLGAVLGGLAHAARRQTTVADQAIALAGEAVRMLEGRARAAGGTPSASVVALRGRLTEVSGRVTTVTALDEVTAALAPLRDSSLAVLDPEPTASADQLYAALRRCQFAYRDEDQLQAALAAALTDAGYTVRREVRLGRDRFDLLVDAVCVEVKLAGSVEMIGRQLARYARHDEVRELLVVTTRARHRALPPTIGGKPCRVLHLGGVR